MDITEQDIRESVEYKGNKKSIKFIATFTGIFSLIYCIFFLTMIQLTFWIMFTYYESKNRRLLHHHKKMHSFEPIFDNLEKKELTSLDQLINNTYCECALLKIE